MFNASPHFFELFFFFLLWVNAYFFVLFQIVDLNPGFLPFTVGSLYIFFISLYITFTSSFILWPYSISSLSVLITTVLNCASDRLAIFVRLVLFLGFCSALSFGPCFFVSSIWQPPCVCFCVLGRAASTWCLGSVA